MRAFVVDSLATVVFFTVLAASTEIFIAGMELKEVLITRLIMIPMMLLTGRPYGMWRDWLFQTLKPTKAWRVMVTDSVAFMSFQLPIYILTLIIAGASWDEIVTLISTTAGIILIISRPFGLYLDYVRAWAGVVKVPK
ncbi:MAG: L-alanine exporter AlaE [Marinomonas sp.]|uniref:L-alanine exporter AlaE n=1 Tax=Marinomonas sp. GJ51-6 TaxID=2992802 RepID=UPI0029343EC0|nr:L-alanine exporter AlaE [Marinomonas sp. GJ51-6]WOD06774.1 L-alanine exporter AlaE [Marinomonas sp. GJ51-6]